MTVPLTDPSNITIRPGLPLLSGIGRSLLLLAVLLTWQVITAYGAVVSAAEKIVFVADWLPGGDQALPFYAWCRGFYSAQGLDVTIITAPGSTAAVEQIATGQADIGSGGLAALLQARAERNVPVRAIMSVFSMQPDALLFPASAGIKSLKDIEFKKVATQPFRPQTPFGPFCCPRMRSRNPTLRCSRLIRANYRRCSHPAKSMQ